MNPKRLLDEQGIAPQKSLGQNFLHDPNMLDKIVAAAELELSDTVLEVGPGTGALTEALARQAGQVIAVEVDRRLEPILAARLAPYPNVAVVYEDILQTDVPSLVGDVPYVVVANLPYYITSAIIRRLLDSPARPRRMVLTVQLEVAERILAKPGDMSLLSISCQFYGRAKLVVRLNPTLFYPRPNVDSAVIRLDMHETPPVSVPDEATFFRVARAGFSQKRKQLKNALGDGLGIGHAAAGTMLEQAGIDPRRRAETLSLDEWAALARAISG